LAGGATGVFGDWTKVWIKSCDGGSYFGDKDAQYKKNTTYFRGSHNVIEALNDMNEKNLFKRASKVLVAGAYNGAIAAAVYAPKIRKYTSAPVLYLSDAGLYLNALNYKDAQNPTNLIEKRAQNIMKLVLDPSNTDSWILPDARSSDEQWQLLFMENLSPELVSIGDLSSYFVQSLYDGQDIKDILGFSCAEELASLS